MQNVFNFSCDYSNAIHNTSMTMHSIVQFIEMSSKSVHTVCHNRHTNTLKMSESNRTERKTSIRFVNKMNRYRFEIQANAHTSTHTHSHHSASVCLHHCFIYTHTLSHIFTRLALNVWLKWRKAITTTSSWSVTSKKLWTTTRSSYTLKNWQRNVWCRGHICVRCVRCRRRRRCRSNFSPYKLIALVNRSSIVTVMICMATQSPTPNVNASAISQRVVIATPFVILDLTLSHT